MSPSNHTEKPSDPASPEVEGRFHTYVGNRIPWYVRLIWLCFWVFAVYYVIVYLLPNLQTEILSPP